MATQPNDDSLLGAINAFGAALTEYDGIERKPLTLKRIQVRPVRPETYTFEDESLTGVIADYRVADDFWWKTGDRPTVQIVGFILDGGGAEQIKVPTHFFSGRDVLRMEAQIADEIEAAGQQDCYAGDDDV